MSLRQETFLGVSILTESGFDLQLDLHLFCEDFLKLVLSLGSFEFANEVKQEAVSKFLFTLLFGHQGLLQLIP